MNLKTIILLILVVIIPLSVFSTEEKPKVQEPQKEAPAEIGKWEGFRGSKWGTERKDIAGFGEKIEFGSLDGYRRKGESLDIGEAKVTMILYCFHNDKLVGIAILSEGHENYVLLKATFKARFGDPTNTSSIAETTFWAEDPSGQTGTAITMKYEDYEKSTEIMIMSLDQMKIMDSDIEEKGKKGAADL